MVWERTGLYTCLYSYMLCFWVVSLSCLTNMYHSVIICFWLVKHCDDLQVYQHPLNFSHFVMSQPQTTTFDLDFYVNGLTQNRVCMSFIYISKDNLKSTPCFCTQRPQYFFLSTILFMPFWLQLFLDIPPSPFDIFIQGLKYFSSQFFQNSSSSVILHRVFLNIHF